ncbi:hypothetical protein FQA39_LY01946 [Lamprigera yunnana]|nr:hypothetical protein FQA39_LY01946 [Lamprigera yunnana]
MAAANQSSLKRKMLYLDKNDGEGDVDFDSDDSVKDKIFEPSGDITPVGEETTKEDDQAKVENVDGEVNADVEMEDVLDI